ncbi:MAG: SAM-dependent methyltransferase, partial [Phycisphaerae bacterium]
CADLGSSTGGFVDCLLRASAEKVYAVERGYGVIDYRLRTDPRVVVMERTDALHVRLPGPVRLVTIDVGWTRQRHILPAATRLLADGGHLITLVKPHYEADPKLLEHGVLPDENLDRVLLDVKSGFAGLNLEPVGETQSPIRGSGGNAEFLWHLRPTRR